VCYIPATMSLLNILPDPKSFPFIMPYLLFENTMSITKFNAMISGLFQLGRNQLFVLWSIMTCFLYVLYVFYLHCNPCFHIMYMFSRSRTNKKDPISVVPTAVVSFRSWWGAIVCAQTHYYSIRTQCGYPQLRHGPAPRIIEDNIVLLSSMFYCRWNRRTTCVSTLV
jgi:hypothetical protein